MNIDRAKVVRLKKLLLQVRHPKSKTSGIRFNPNCQVSFHVKDIESSSKKSVNLSRSIAVILSLLLAAFSVDAQENPHSGLFFRSHEVIQDERTSLNITPDDPIRIKDELVIEFEALFRQGDGYYGYIFKTLANGKTPIDLVSNLASESENFWLVVGEKAVFSFFWAELGGDVYNSWIKIRLSYIPSSREISLSINGIEKAGKIENLERLDTFQMVFGSSSVPNMLNSDVCPMTVKNLSIKDANREIRFWELGKHGKESVYDQKQGARAEVSYPVWEIDRQLYWRKLERIVFPGIVGITSNPSADTIFLVARDRMMVYLPESRNSFTQYFNGGNPYPCLENNLVYSADDNEIWSYSFDSPLVSKLDLKSLIWSASPDTCPEPDLWHHSKFLFSPAKKIKTFGGYGHYNYKSSQWTLSETMSEWDSMDYSAQITPRYLSAAGRLSDNKALIFGGYGSPSGKQGINPQYYYDLYTWNLENGDISKLRDINVEKHPFTPVADLIVSENGESFFTLIFNNTNYNTSLNLVKVGIHEDSFVQYQDSIPYNFLDTDSWAGLFHNSKNSTLVALTRTDSILEIYERSFPPILVSDAIQMESSQFSWYEKSLIWALLVGTLSGLVWLLYRKKRQLSQKDDLSGEMVKPAVSDEIMVASPPKISRDSASLNLMGGFQIFDVRGKDITGQFTPTLKQLFLLIYLSGIFDKKGISSDRLTELLWGDKSLTNARNNRNVNISKLRLLLEKIAPDIQLVHDNTYWKIEHGKSIHSDLKDTLLVLDKIRSGTAIGRAELEHLLNNTAKGDICPGIQNEWMDQFKTALAGTILDGLFLLVKQEKDQEVLVSISDCILKFDPLNDEAITLKCQSLFNSGKKGLALTAYKLFAKEYHTMLGQAFEKSFNDIVGNNYDVGG